MTNKKYFIIKPFDIELSPYGFHSTEREAIESLVKLGHHCWNINDYKTIMEGILCKKVYIFSREEAEKEIENEGEFSSILRNLQREF